MRYRSPWLPAALVLIVSAAAWSAPYDTRRDVLPAGSVLKVRLDDPIGSDRSQRGDRFTATVTNDGSSSDLPSGARVEGVVADVQRSASNRPGMLDVRFQNLLLPDGERYRMAGSPISLDDNSVRRTSDGRLEARSSSKNSTKFLAYGAGAGFILGALTHGNKLTDALLGAAAGYLYGQYDKGKANGHEVRLNPGTEFGVRLDQSLALAPASDNRYGQPRVGGYRSQIPSRGPGYGTSSRDRYGSDRDSSDRYNGDRYSSDRYNGDRYNGDRSNTDRSRSDDSYGHSEPVSVFVNDRGVQFDTARPFRSGDHIMVPLLPVLDFTDLNYRYHRDNDQATLEGPREVQLRTGSAVALVDGRRLYLNEPVQVRNGMFYVPADFFRSALGMQTRWDAERGTLTMSR